MEFGPNARPVHTRRNTPNDTTADSRQAHSRNHWVAGEGGQRNGVNGLYHHSDGEKWERGGHRGSRGRGTSRGTSRGGRGRFSNVSLRLNGAPRQPTPHSHQDEAMDSNEVEEVSGPEEPVLETQEEREKFYQEVCGILVLGDRTTDPFLSW
jgi:nuclear mRNA export protein SAC3